MPTPIIPAAGTSNTTGQLLGGSGTTTNFSPTPAPNTNGMVWVPGVNGGPAQLVPAGSSANPYNYSGTGAQGTEASMFGNTLTTTPIDPYSQQAVLASGKPNAQAFLASLQATPGMDPISQQYLVQQFLQTGQIPTTLPNGQPFGNSAHTAGSTGAAPTIQQQHPSWKPKTVDGQLIGYQDPATYQLYDLSGNLVVGDGRLDEALAGTSTGGTGTGTGPLSGSTGNQQQGPPTQQAQTVQQLRAQHPTWSPLGDPNSPSGYTDYTTGQWFDATGNEVKMPVAHPLTTGGSTGGSGSTSTQYGKQIVSLGNGQALGTDASGNITLGTTDAQGNFTPIPSGGTSTGGATTGGTSSGVSSVLNSVLGGVFGNSALPGGVLGGIGNTALQAIDWASLLSGLYYNQQAGQNQSLLAGLSADQMKAYTNLLNQYGANYPTQLGQINQSNNIENALLAMFGQNAYPELLNNAVSSSDLQNYLNKYYADNGYMNLLSNTNSQDNVQTILQGLFGQSYPQLLGNTVDTSNIAANLQGQYGQNYFPQALQNALGTNNAYTSAYDNTLSQIPADYRAQFQKLANLTPGDISKGITSLEQPLSQDLINNTMRTVQAQLGERGLSEAPGIMSEQITQTLAPYLQHTQDQAQSAYFSSLTAPNSVPIPGLNAPLSAPSGTTPLSIPSAGLPGIQQATPPTIPGAQTVPNIPASGVIQPQQPSSPPTPVQITPANLTPIIQQLMGGGSGINLNVGGGGSTAPTFPGTPGSNPGPVTPKPPTPPVQPGPIPIHIGIPSFPSDPSPAPPGETPSKITYKLPDGTTVVDGNNFVFGENQVDNGVVSISQDGTASFVGKNNSSRLDGTYNPQTGNIEVQAPAKDGTMQTYTYNPSTQVGSIQPGGSIMPSGRGEPGTWNYDQSSQRWDNGKGLYGNANGTYKTDSTGLKIPLTYNDQYHVYIGNDSKWYDPSDGHPLSSAEVSMIVNGGNAWQVGITGGGGGGVSMPGGDDGGGSSSGASDGGTSVTSTVSYG